MKGKGIERKSVKWSKRERNIERERVKGRGVESERAKYSK